MALPGALLVEGAWRSRRLDCGLCRRSLAVAIADRRPATGDRAARRGGRGVRRRPRVEPARLRLSPPAPRRRGREDSRGPGGPGVHRGGAGGRPRGGARRGDRKSTRLNSSHSQISYAVFCLKKKKKKNKDK